MNHTMAARFFQRAAPLWLLGFMISALPSAERLWDLPVSPVWVPPGPISYVTHALCGQVPGFFAMLTAAVILMVAAWQLFAGARWWAWAIIWLAYVNLMNRAWMAGSGGQQLMANVLFWSIFLAMRSERAQFLGLWAIRLQLLLAYLATGLHKLTGTHWLDGTAMGIAASDQAFGPAWLASAPGLSSIITWCVLLFQLSFPIAIWFRQLRLPWMLFGIAFHLGTAIWMDIPEMGLAFVACYAFWFGEGLLSCGQSKTHKTNQPLQRAPP
ncbi:MAG: HTTM domain-containing protein [Flavobacteriales bacterium]|nr:HTTM domain-containing protein [Flavobacteriales bacterium]